MIVAADNMGDAHVVIVNHDGQHIGWRPVRAEQDEVVNLGIGYSDAALNLILDHGFTFARRLDPHDVRDIGRPACHPRIAPFAFKPERAAFGLGLFAARGQFFATQVAAIGVPCGNKLCGDFGMARRPGELEYGSFVTFQAEP